MYFVLLFPVQEKPTKGPVQGDRFSNIPFSDWLFTDNLWGPSSGRNYWGWGEFGMFMY